MVYIGLDRERGGLRLGWAFAVYARFCVGLEHRGEGGGVGGLFFVEDGLWDVLW